MTKVEQIKQWALDNYNACYGASTLIECYTDEELDAEFDSLEAAKEYAGFESDREEIRREPVAWALQDAMQERLSGDI